MAFHLLDSINMPTDDPLRVGIGVDLGTTYSGVAIAYKDQFGQHQRVTIRNEMNEVKFPSVVYFPEGGGFLVGKEAINHSVAESRESNLLKHFKLKMGSGETLSYWREGKKVSITPIELSAILLKAIKRMVDGKLRELNLQQADQRWVISVPGQWPMANKFATRDAAVAAGVDRSKIDLIEEPTAAAIAARAAMPNRFLFDEAMLIVDFGGGTLDLSIVRPHQGSLDVVLAPGGNNQFGGTNIDSAVALLLMSSTPTRDGNKSITVDRRELGRRLASVDNVSNDQRARYLTRAERQKESISDEIATGHPDEEFPVSFQLAPGVIQRSTIKRRDFEEILSLTSREIERSVTAYLQEAKKQHVHASDIGKVVLVGGSSMLPSVEEAISTVVTTAIEQYDVKQNMPQGVRLSRNQRQEMIQLGAAMFAYDHTLIRARVCGFTCGVASTRDWKEGDEEHLVFSTSDGRKKTRTYSRFFRRNEMVSLEGVTQSFTPIEDGQASVRFRVLQGDNDDPHRNREIGTSTVSIDETVPREQMSVMCKFVLERDNLLHVYTWNPKTGERGEEVKFEWKSGSVQDWLDG